MLFKNVLVILFILFGFLKARSLNNQHYNKRNVFDQSIHGYLMERTCWWNEVCKEEFQSLFRCRCPTWSFCRAPGRYYNAFCAMSATGYIWSQPQWENPLRQKKSLIDIETTNSTTESVPT